MPGPNIPDCAIESVRTRARCARSIGWVLVWCVVAAFAVVTPAPAAAGDRLSQACDEGSAASDCDDDIGLAVIAPTTTTPLLALSTTGTTTPTIVQPTTTTTTPTIVQPTTTTTTPTIVQPTTTTTTTSPDVVVATTPSTPPSSGQAATTSPRLSSDPPPQTPEDAIVIDVLSADQGDWSDEIRLQLDTGH